ncbi:MlaD family protein [Rosistilla oblonga]|uniref:MlaD family protein n=1 Tax=Rosistilla oblonga TaxID=2527990 RepID=UPI003A976F15
MNDPYRLRYTNQVVGTFLLVILLFSLVVSFLMIRTKDYFAEKDHFWIDVPQHAVDGLQKGSEVVILGERAGEVEGIRYIDQTSNVRVSLAIRREYSKRVFTSSTVALERRYGGVGAPLLVIRRGMPADGVLKQLPPDSEIVNFEGEEDRMDQLTREVQSVSDSIKQIELKMVPTMDTIDKAAKTIDTGTEEDARPAFRSMGEASAAFQQTNEQLRPEASQTMLEIRQATQNLDQRITQLTEKIELLVEADMRDTLRGVRDTSDDVSDAAGSVKTTATDVNADVANTLVEIREAADEMTRLANEARDVVRVVRKESEELPGTVEQFNATVGNADDMVGEIRSHWLLRRYTDQSPTTRQLSPSGIRAGGAP